MLGSGPVLDYLRQLNLVSLLLRLLLATLCGGFIGLEREFKRRPAGFRTYLLVCVGACAAMLLGQYAVLMLSTCWSSYAAGASADVSRIGAQVINGIGFLGAGTVLVTGRQEVKGLTTAAGLWSSACLGLAVGAGFYECVLLGFALILLCFRVFPLLEVALLARARNRNLYVEFQDGGSIGPVLTFLKANDVQIYDVELHDAGEHLTLSRRAGAVLSLKLPHRCRHERLYATLLELDAVAKIEEV